MFEFRMYSRRRPHPDDRETMAGVLETWMANQKFWGEGFLSWNRDKKEELGDFVKYLEAKAKEKGINLITDRDFDPKFYDNNPGRFSCLFPVSYVILSEDYVRSEKCMRQLLDMIRFNMEPLHAIHYYTETEIQDRDFRFDRLLDIAYQTAATKNEVEQQNLEHTFTRYFYSFPLKCEALSAAVADLALSRTMPFVIAQYPWFPDCYTFPALDACAKRGYDIITNSPIMPQDDTIYLGIKGSNAKYNKFVAENIGLPSRLESFEFKQTDMICDVPYQRDAPREGYDLFIWGLCEAESILGLSITTIEHNYHTSIINNLPKKKCFLVIENIPDYNNLKALAFVFDFLSPGSRIVFTTTNEDFFTGYENSWRMDSGNAGLPTFSVRNRILDTDELNDVKKILG